VKINETNIVTHQSVNTATESIHPKLKMSAGNFQRMQHHTQHPGNQIKNLKVCGAPIRNRDMATGKSTTQKNKQGSH
jgi:hypothetical protein